MFCKVAYSFWVVISIRRVRFAHLLFYNYNAKNYFIIYLKIFIIFYSYLAKRPHSCRLYGHHKWIRANCSGIFRHIRHLEMHLDIDPLISIVTSHSQSFFGVIIKHAYQCVFIPLRIGCRLFKRHFKSYKDIIFPYICRTCICVLL